MWKNIFGFIKKSNFHPKIFLIKFNNFIRIVIGSQNLYIGDWNVWSNIFYLKDFPIKLTTHSITNLFKEDLNKFIFDLMEDKVNLLKEFCQIDLDNYFIEENDFTIIKSIPGYYDKNNQ